MREAMGRLFRLSSITGESEAHDGSRICANSGSRNERSETAGAFAEAVIRSVELIVQPDAQDVVGEMRVSGERTGKRRNGEKPGHEHRRKWCGDIYRSE